jgi:dTDP-4-dehydrorhamnose reductase
MSATIEIKTTATNAVTDGDDDTSTLISPMVMRNVEFRKRLVRVLITGATGLLGRALVSEFAEYEVLGLGYSRVGADVDGKRVATHAKGHLTLRRCDLNDAQSIGAIFDEFVPQIVVHAAAERRPDVCANDEEATRKMNVSVTERLAALTAVIDDSFMLLISTDYVFDGTEPPYKPNSEPRPLNLYGQTKWQAEQALWASGHNGGVLRVPVLYGRTDDLAESAVTVLVDAVRKAAADGAEPVSVDAWAKRVPTLVDDVAIAVRQLCERRLRHCALSGTWHWSGPDVLTKYDMARIMADVLELGGADNLVACHDVPAGAARPQNCQLDTTVLYLMGIGRKTFFKDGIALVLNDYLSRHKMG